MSSAEPEPVEHHYSHRYNKHRVTVLSRYRAAVGGLLRHMVEIVTEGGIHLRVFAENVRKA